MNLQTRSKPKTQKQCSSLQAISFLGNKNVCGNLYKSENQRYTFVI